MLPLIGRWQGGGAGVVASSGREFAFAQQLSFVHDGRPFLSYESRSWLVDEHGAVLRPAWRESGFWRPGTDPDDLEVVLAANTGQALVFAGVAGELRWELGTTTVARTPTAEAVAGERRLYALVDEALTYVTELAPAGQPYAAHLNARLTRH